VCVCVCMYVCVCVCVRARARLHVVCSSFFFYGRQVQLIFFCIAVEEMRRRGYSHLLLSNNDVIIPPLSVRVLLQQLRFYDLVVPISSRHGSGFGSESCCICSSGIVSARSWAVAAAETPLCAASIQRLLADDRAEIQSGASAPVWVDGDSGALLLQ
jgi:hypothetical protein